MADKKISQLTSATLPLAGTEILPLVQGGATVKALQADLFQWPTGRVTYVPIGGNIQAAVTAAAAGDTLILGAGSYPITATITVDKAILIKGQGLSATKITTATADIAAFTLTASSARITDLYIGHSGTGTTYGIYAGDGLTSLQVRNVTVVTSGAGVKYCVYSKSSITVSDTECYPTSSDSNSNGVYITNDSGATVNISANVQGVRVIATGAATNNRGVVFFNNNTVKLIAGNVFNCSLTALASSGTTDNGLLVSSATSNSITANIYDTILNGADADVGHVGANTLTLFNCTLINGTTTGTIAYGGTQVAGISRSTGMTVGFQSIATATSTTTFTVASPTYTIFTGTAAQTLVLPDARTLTVGRRFMVDNDSTLAITVQNATPTTLWTVASGCDLYITCSSIATAAGTWELDYAGAKAATAKSLTISNTLTLAGTDATTHTFPTTSSSVARTDAAQTFTGDQTSTGDYKLSATGSSIQFATASATSEGKIPVKIVDRNDIGTRHSLDFYTKTDGQDATIHLQLDPAGGATLAKGALSVATTGSFGSDVKLTAVGLSVQFATASATSEGTTPAKIVDRNAIGTRHSLDFYTKTDGQSATVHLQLDPAGGATFAKGIVSVSDATDASNSTTASLKTAGGLAIAKKSYFGDVIVPVQAATASAPAYLKGAIYFDTTLNKLRVGGATAWETITSV